MRCVTTLNFLQGATELRECLRGYLGTVGGCCVRSSPPVQIEAVDKGKRRFMGCALMSVGALLAVATTSGCSVTTTNGVTTITLDVAKVKAYGQAGLNAAATVSSFLSAFPALAPYAAAISVADTALSGALTATPSTSA